jgi:protein-tyrosine-phosphatase
MASILIVCTANRCRSPMAEALLRRRLDERGIVAHVTSAGFLDPGLPAMEDAVETMAEDGYDLSAHRSRTATAGMVTDADLVVAMTHRHVIDLTVMVPDVWPSIFQLTDLVRRAESLGESRTESFAGWLAAVGRGRTRAGLLTAGQIASQQDDIADPVGQPRPAYDRTKQRLDHLVTRLAGLLG